MKPEYSTFDESAGLDYHVSKEYIDNVRPNPLKRKLPEVKEEVKVKPEPVCVDLCDSDEEVSQDSTDSSNTVKKPKYTYSVAGETRLIKPENYQLIKSTYKNGGEKQTLFVFTNFEKSQGYEFTWCRQKLLFVCRGCNNNRTRRVYICGRIEKDEEGDNVFKVQTKEHSCKPRPFGKHLEEAYQRVYGDMFHLIDYEVKGIPKQKMFIFFDKDKKECYEFNWATSTENFVCCGCRQKKKSLTAKLMEDETGEDYVAIQNKDHVCKPRLYQPDQYLKPPHSIRKPDYELIERVINGQEKRRLFVFDQKDKSLCYEYSPCFYSKSFICCGCTAIKAERCRAKVINQGEDDEYVELINHDLHECELRLFDPDNTFREKKILKLPGFEVQSTIKNGSEKKTLIIFDPEDRTKCYKYYYAVYDRRFVCTRCNRSNHSVVARVRTGSDGEDYVELGFGEHICELCDYQPSKEVVITDENFHSFEREGTSRVFIYSNTEKTQGHEYIKSNRNSFKCMSCSDDEEAITLEVCKKSTGESYVSMKNQPHDCKPLPFEPPEEEKPTDFMFFVYAPRPNTTYLVVFPSTDQTLCYRYLYKSWNQTFFCCKCNEKRKQVTAKIVKDPSGKEILSLGKNDHFCSAVKFSTLKVSDAQILPSTEFIFKNKPGLPKNLDESRIIKAGTYEFRENTKGEPEGRLVIFHPKNKKLCYEFAKGAGGTGLYSCMQCKRRRQTTSVKVFSQEDGGEQLVVMGEELNHVCRPVKYEVPKELPKYRDFILLDANLKEKNPSLIVFADSDRKMCYVCYYREKYKAYCCRGCSSKNKRNIRARIHTDSDGSQYAKFEGGEHICELKVYNPERFEKKQMITAANFKLVHSIKGTPETKLILFNPKTKELAYDYSFTGTSFKCRECAPKGKRVAAWIRQSDNNELYLETDGAQHICQIQDLVDTGRYLEAAKFKQETDEAGLKFIIARCPDRDDLYYKLVFDAEKKAFCCVQCKAMGRCITGSICKNEKEEDFLLLNHVHYCKPCFSDL